MQRNGLKLSQNVIIFLKKLNNMVLLCKILETEKRKRPTKHYVSLIWLIKYFNFFPGKDLFFIYFEIYIYIFFSVYPFSFIFVILFCTTVVRCICLY